MKKSITPKNSSFSSASRVKLASGKDTSGLKQMESRPLISPRWIASIISTAVSRPGNLVRLDAPHLRHVPPRLWIRDRPLPRQLIAFLSVLAAALTVALSGNHHAARALAADIAGGRHRLIIARTFSTPFEWCSMPRAWRPMPRSAAANHRAAFSIASGGTPVMRAAVDRVHGFADSATASKPAVCRVDEFAILQAIAHDHVQHGEQNRRDRCPDAPADTDRHCA